MLGACPHLLPYCLSAGLGVSSRTRDGRLRHGRRSWFSPARDRWHGRGVRIRWLSWLFTQVPDQSGTIHAPYWVHCREAAIGHGSCQSCLVQAWLLRFSRFARGASCASLRNMDAGVEEPAVEVGAGAHWPGQCPLSLPSPPRQSEIE